MSKRRKFSAEFKRGAVEQASQPGAELRPSGPKLSSLPSITRPNPHPVCLLPANCRHYFF